MTDSTDAVDGPAPQDPEPSAAAEGEGASGAAHARAVLEHVVKAVVSQPDEVTISESRHRSGAIGLDVSVDRSDMGRVIGKRGRVAHAIRTVVKAAATRDGVSVEVEFLE
jgi:predicted RNA-binding protein YlqC (UPF0109 family)